MLVGLAAITACAPTATGATAATPGVSAERAAELEAIYRARVTRDRERFVEADVHFMTAMIEHHAQALVMAGLAPDRAARQQIRTLAARIVNAQEDEITLMQSWLRHRGQPVPEAHISGTILHVQGGSHAHHHGMPGMLSQAQLDELARAEGEAFDELFLTYMIEHHRGAVIMVRELFGADGAAQDPEIFRFASDVHVDQATEIARMERMLAEFAASGPTR